MNIWIKKQKGLLTGGSFDGIVSPEENFKVSYVNDEAALDSFKNHWLQAWNIMQTKTAINDQKDENTNLSNVTSDDVTSIINHIEQLISLLLQENHKLNNVEVQKYQFESTPIMISPLLDYLLMESILDKIFSWSSNIGEFTNIMKLEQLKLYNLLISQLCHKSMLFQAALIRPLLHLLSTCKDCAPLEVEKRLVILLNTLCVFLSQNTDLLELFFVTDKNKNNNIASSMDEVKSSPQLKNKLSYLDNPESRFLIFSLLISFVHREGTIGQTARNSLLLIMSLSKNYPSIGIYIAENTNFCPVLATGLSGLYSLLPRKLMSEVMSAKDWHQLTNEDINEITELQTFLNSLLFCNAVIEVSHPLVKQQLLEYISQGFLISVIGPALHQDIMQFPIEVLERYPKFSNTIENIIATTSYLELCLRTVTEPDLLQVFLKFIFTEKFDGQRILDTLISRINCNKKLSLVSIVLFKTLLDLNCEDVMVELIFKYLLNLDFLNEKNCQQIDRILDTSRLDLSARKLLNFIPVNNISKNINSKEDNSISEMLSSLNFSSDFLTESTENLLQSLLQNEHLMNNYTDYLDEAHISIRLCIKACSNWTKFSEKELNLTYKIFSKDCDEKENNKNFKNKNNLNDITNDLTCEEYHFDKNISLENRIIGPFLSSIFDKLENFSNNDIYMNLQLTGLLSRLLTYPQSILRSFLFNDNLYFHSSIRTLWKILPKIKYKLEKNLEKIENYDELLINAKEYFKNREKILLNDISTNDELLNDNEKSFKRQKSSRTPSITSEKIIIKVEPSKDNKRKIIRDFWNKLRNDKSSENPKQEIEYVNKKVSNTSKLDFLSKNLTENQSFVLSVLIFQEFMKEISALCQEHYILQTEFFEN